MKTAVSIPDDVFESAERLARRTKKSRSRLFSDALRDNGVEVKFIAYPVSGHFPGDPVRSKDLFKRWLAWLDEHMR